MMKLLKKLLIGISVFFLVFLGLTLYGVYELDALVKAAIEKYGTESVHAKVSVGSANVSLKNAKVTLKNFTIANPEGFEEKQAFHANEVVIDLDEHHVGTSRVVVQKITITAPQLTYEHSRAGDNLTVLQNNAIAYAKRIAQQVGADSETSTSQAKTKILIKDVYLNQGRLVLRDSRLLGLSVQLPLPDIHLTQLGNGQDGAEPQQVAGQLMDSLLGTSKKVVNESAPAALEQAGVQLKNAETAVKNAGNQTMNELKKLFSK